MNSRKHREEISACRTVERISTCSSPLERMIPFVRPRSTSPSGTDRHLPLCRICRMPEEGCKGLQPVIFFIFSSTPFSDLCITIVFFHALLSIFMFQHSPRLTIMAIKVKVNSHSHIY